MVSALDFFDSDNNNNLTPVIKTGTTAQIEYNRIRVAPRSLTCIQRFLFGFFCDFHTVFFAHPIYLKGLNVFLYFSKTNSYFQG